MRRGNLKGSWGRQAICRRLCATEGLSWLWPELDMLTESDEGAIAEAAWEAIERLREEFLGPLG